MIKTLQVDFQHQDARGQLIQLVHQGYEQINVLESKAGVFRGGHYHKISTEAFYVVTGSVEVHATRDKEEEKKTFHAGDFFAIEPYVVHSMKFPEDCIMVQMYSICVQGSDGTMDIYSEGDK